MGAESAMNSVTDQRSLSELVSDAIDQVSKLIRNEAEIARAEVAEKATAAAIGIALLVGGALVVIPAMVLLLMALAAWLTELGLQSSLSNLIAGVIALVVSAVLAYAGRARLKPQNLKPHRTIAELERDATVVREQV